MKYCVYCLTNKINNKSYIGYSENVNERLRSHRKRSLCTAPAASYKKYAIHNALGKYGLDNFAWEILETFTSKLEMIEAEEFYIAYFQTLAPNGYNLTKGGEGNSPNLETRKKISNTLKTSSFFVGKKGKDHPNFGKIVSEKEKENLKRKFSGENSHKAKITKETAQEIYQKFLNNPNITGIDLSNQYGLARSTISNILLKKSWKNELSHFPAISSKLTRNKQII